MSPPRVVIFSIAGAPYRDSFYSLLAGEMPDSEVIYAKVMDKAPDHAWSPSELSGAANFREEHLPAISLRGRGWLHRWRQGRNPLVLPTLSTWRQISDWDPGVLLIQEYSPVSLVLLLWAKLHGRKVFVMTEIGESTGAEVGFTTRVRHSFFGRFVDGQLAHTLAARQPIATGLENVCFSPHAVEVDEGQSGAEALVPDLDPDRIRILFVGNLIERKGIDLLLKACRQLCGAGYSGRFLLRLVGGGDTAWIEGDLEAMGENVELAGFREKKELLAEYRAAQVFVLPSRFDTFGVVSHEAAAQGLALVLSSHAGSSELFGTLEGAAEVVDPEDVPALAGVLRRLIDEPEFRRERGAAARKTALKWSSGRNAARAAKWLLAEGAHQPE